LLADWLAYVMANSTSRRRVLNAGAGEGLFSSLLLGLLGVHQVMELDVSYASSPRFLSDPRQHSVAGSLTALPVTEATFDLVLCSEVLEHIEDDESALDELRRVLAPDGWLVITVPTPPAILDPDHVREGYDPLELKKKLAARGLETIEIGFCMYGAFKLMMRAWRRFPWLPRAAIWALALTDRFLSPGSPMDLLVLSRRPIEETGVPPALTTSAETCASESQ
jgi:SAM-dependent methyltransferase